MPFSLINEVSGFDMKIIIQLHLQAFFRDIIVH